MKKTLTMSLISYLLEPVDTWKALKSLTNSWGWVVRYLKQDATIRCTFIFAYQFSDEIWFTVFLTITYINITYHEDWSTHGIFWQDTYLYSSRERLYLISSSYKNFLYMWWVVFFKTKHHIDILYHLILASIDKVSSDNELFDLCVC